jgi:phospholipase/carboxylesterase
MKLSLDTTIINPISGNRPKNAIILLHGYGADGKNISLLALNWARFLPDTIFFCPNGPEKCSISNLGYQWFDLSSENEKIIFEKSLIAERKVTQYIDEIKKKYELENSNICLSGFSQGCMISISVGLTLKEELNCIVGFSGKIINKENLLNRINTKPKIFLLHGDMDPVVLPTYLLESKELFFKIDYKIKTKLLKNCEHYISIEASSLALEFIKKNLYK